MIRISSFFVPSGKAAITLWPFIFIAKEKYRTEKLINHEKIHIRQQVELLVIPFYLLYVLMFLVNVVLGKKSAYKSIPFEKEANAHEEDYEYLNNRPFWAWTKYIEK